jgi:hypothetical protein
MLILAVFVPGGQAQVIGVAAFTFAFIVTIPSWLNEKKAGVSLLWLLLSSAFD